MAACRPGSSLNSRDFESNGALSRAGEVSAMKHRSLVTSSLVALALLASAPWIAPAQAQQTLPYDGRAIFVTHVPHVNSRVSTAGGGPTSPQPLNPAVISGPGYSVGSSVSATSTFPAAVSISPWTQGIRRTWWPRSTISPNAVASTPPSTPSH